MQTLGQARRGGRLPTPPGPKGSNGTELSLGAADLLLRHFLLIKHLHRDASGELQQLLIELNLTLILWHNTPMSRWHQILLVALLGLAAGLFYGWRVAPVEYVDLAPNTLHADYRAEYILMVAESYQSEKDLDLAARRLALLSSAHPVEIIAESLDESDYTKNEIELLEELQREIRTWQPSLAEAAQ